MDPPSDPPPPPLQPPLDLAIYDANSTHPSYEEMITAAILGLNEQNGSNRRAISKYIETHYSNLPPTHSALLTHHLKRLKLNGHLLMVKHSYHLPRSATDPPSLNGSLTVNALPSDPVSPTSKRRPGRPPKPRTDAVQPAVPVFAPSVDMNALPDVVPVAASPVNGPAPGVPVRGRGRPPKQSGSKRGRPRKTGSFTPAVGSTGRGRGRPRKNAPGPALAVKEEGQGRSRGRPRKSVNIFQGFAPGVPVVGGIVPVPVAAGGIAPVAGKRRGRPPKDGVDAKKPRIFATGQQKKARKLSGKPLGRPRKNAAQSQDSQLLVAYLDLKAKLENLQSTVKQTSIVIKPYLHNETAINAVQELELVAMSVSAPSNSQRPQPQPQHLQPEQPHLHPHLHPHPHPHPQPELQPQPPTHI